MTLSRAGYGLRNSRSVRYSSRRRSPWRGNQPTRPSAGVEDNLSLLSSDKPCDILYHRYFLEDDSSRKVMPRFLYFLQPPHTYHKLGPAISQFLHICHPTRIFFSASLKEGGYPPRFHTVRFSASQDMVSRSTTNIVPFTEILTCYL
jgi:hypothetical protein